MVGIPVIALTSNPITSDREKAIKAVCNDYICRPIEYQSFMEKIDDFFSKRAENT